MALPGRQRYSCGYDLDGNLTNDGVWVYAWDAENRLMMASNTSKVLCFNYDYMGRRAMKTVFTNNSDSWLLTSDSSFVYDGWNMVQEVSSQNSESRTNQYVWGLDLSGTLGGAGGIGGLLASILNNPATNNSTTVFYTYDGNGNVTTLVDTNGSVAASYTYDPFGGLLSTIHNSPVTIHANPYTFSTKYHDEETGLSYYGYRYYSPGLGRWLNRDLLEEQGGVNLNGFSLNDPMNNVDLFGLEVSIGYRPLGITGLTKTFPMTGHSFLIFDNKNMGAAWRDALQCAGFDPNIPSVAMSFHPDSVPSGDTSLNRVSVIATDSSAVTYNRPEDSAVAEGRSGKMYLVTSCEEEQIRLFNLARASARINNASPEGHDASGPYSFPKNNCSSWAKDMCDAAGLRPVDRLAYAKMNMGVGQETGLDLTGIPQATYALARGSVVIYDAGKIVVVTTASVASDAVIAAAKNTARITADVGRTVDTTVRHVINSAEIMTNPYTDGSQVRRGVGWRF